LKTVPSHFLAVAKYGILLRGVCALHSGLRRNRYLTT